MRSLNGATVSRVVRRGKHQLLELDDGRVLHAHFRLNGDWVIGRVSDPLPRFARAELLFRNGTRVVLEDSRALSTLDVHAADAPPTLSLGPEPEDPALTAERLAAVLATRRAPIKSVLLDQRVIAGLGNIYAAEALWRARIDPRASGAALRPDDVRNLLAAIRFVIRRASGARYRAADVVKLDVYDREGRACRRCRTPIARIQQSGRSTYYCPRCQRRGTVLAALNRSPRASRL